MPELPEPVPLDRPTLAPEVSSEVTVSGSGRLLFIFLVMVFAAALVWLLIRSSGSHAVSPMEIVLDLSRPGKSHWQQAHVLAELLRNPQHAEVKHDSGLRGTRG